MSTKFANIFVLGAGASVDYGLPIWCELSDLLIQQVTEIEARKFSLDIWNRLVGELEEIGSGKKYSTVDEMISKFSRSTPDFAEVTEEIFEQVKIILKSRVITENVGWIEELIDKNDLEILLTRKATNYSTVFINFNYDTLLVSKIVQFFHREFRRTPNEEKAEWYTQTGLDFERKFEYCANHIYHPHGVLYLFDGNEIKIGEKTFCYPTTKTFINAQTTVEDRRVSSYGSGSNNAISCHDAHEQFTFADIKERIHELAGGAQGDVEVRLIVLGVGPDALEFNLDKIFDGQRFHVKQVHYTCKREHEIHIYKQYFDKFQATTMRYKNCKELIQKNTFIPFN